MALQLGILRDALLAAGVDGARASAAAEEVAGYGSRLIRLSTQMQFMIALLVLLIVSQAALWSGYGKLSGQISEVQSEVMDVQGQMQDMQAQLAEIRAQNARMAAQLAHMASVVR